MARTSPGTFQATPKVGIHRYAKITDQLLAKDANYLFRSLNLCMYVYIYMWNKQCPLDLLVDDGSIEVCIILFISRAARRTSGTFTSLLDLPMVFFPCFSYFPTFQRGNLMKSPLSKLFRGPLGTRSAYRVFVKDESCLENVRQAVDHFAASTGLPEELNSTELDALMARVLEEMEIFCKHDHIENITDPQAPCVFVVGVVQIWKNNSTKKTVLIGMIRDDSG